MLKHNTHRQTHDGSSFGALPPLGKSKDMMKQLKPQILPQLEVSEKIASF